MKWFLLFHLGTFFQIQISISLGYLNYCPALGVHRGVIVRKYIPTFRNTRSLSQVKMLFRHASTIRWFYVP